MSDRALTFLRSKYVQDSYIPPLEPEPLAVCTPMYNSMPFLDEYLTHVLLYDYPKDLTSLYFTVQGKDGTYDTLKEFKETWGDEYRKIKFQRVKQNTGGPLPHVANVVRCRNLLIKWSRPDLVFFNDHDNFNPPVSIKRLRQGLALGASIAAGTYTFYQRDPGEDVGRICFTTFYLKGDQQLHALSLKEPMHGYFPLEIFGRRMWVDAVSCGCMMVKRELLDEQQFFVPYGTPMTDDTAFCLKARELGHRIISDLGLVVRHWGYNVYFKQMMEIGVGRSEEMMDRRSKMRRDGIYVAPDIAANINEAVRKLIDLDKIK